MVEDFRGLLQAFICRFGLLAGDQTPCGKPLPVSDAHALMCLLEAGEAGLLQTTLVTRLGIDKSTVSRVIARLSDRGLVASVPSPADGRARPIRLTRKADPLGRCRGLTLHSVQHRELSISMYLAGRFQFVKVVVNRLT